jgi:hypothetical protein
LRYRFFLALLLALALLGALLVAGYADAHAAELRAARTRWQQRPFARYQLVVAQDHNRCRHEAEVLGTQISSVRSNPCGLPDRTVDDLLAQIERSTPTTYPCVAFGCACETVVSVAGLYNPQLGYPRELGRRWVVRLNWRHVDFWRYLLQQRALPPCRKETFIKTIDVLTLTPLP